MCSRLIWRILYAFDYTKQQSVVFPLMSHTYSSTIYFLGESLLHIFIICDTLVHTKIARLLLKVFPRCALDMIEGEEYLGATGLHLAIAYGNDELATAIIECGVNIHIRARGTFFLPRDQQHDKPKKITDYEGLAYLGEYALAWSACQCNEGVYNLLLAGGANPDSKDRFGNR